ncbi:MAG: M48 family metallopeptidase [candidate division KSB1 bacterium]|nr:M48 family metallopeptidase [candidate division KSB1 bacterium]
MNYDRIRIASEKQSSRELYDLFEVDIIKQILGEGKVENQKDYVRAVFEGRDFKITDKMAPKLYQICKEVRDALEFEEPIDFFVTNAPDINAAAIYRLEEEHRHLISLNSGLIERFNDQELRFVIGHEIGHLISRSAELERIIQFVFPDENRMPLVLKNKIYLWRKLAELSADRYGYIAAPDLQVCVSNFFKLSSGLDTTRIAFDLQSYFAETEKILQNYTYSSSIQDTFHPINPVRIKALKLFSESKLYHELDHNSEKPDEDLSGEIEKLIDLLMVMDDSEIGAHRKHYLASGGLLIAGLDGELDQREVDRIVHSLASFTMFPSRFLSAIIESEKVQDIFTQSCQNVLKLNPGERHGMFYYLVEIAISDHDLLQKEIDVLYDIGEKLFGFSRIEIAQMIAEKVHREFVPRFFLHGNASGQE